MTATFSLVAAIVAIILTALTALYMALEKADSSRRGVFIWSGVTAIALTVGLCVGSALPLLDLLRPSSQASTMPSATVPSTTSSLAAAGAPSVPMTTDALSTRVAVDASPEQTAVRRRTAGSSTLQVVMGEGLDIDTPEAAGNWGQVRDKSTDPVDMYFDYGAPESPKQFIGEFAVVSGTDTSWTSCSSAIFSPRRKPIIVQEGVRLCIKTDQQRWAVMRLVKLRDRIAEVEITVWQS